MEWVIKDITELKRENLSEEDIGNMDFFERCTH